MSARRAFSSSICRRAAVSSNSARRYPSRPLLGSELVGEAPASLPLFLAAAGSLGGVASLFGGPGAVAGDDVADRVDEPAGVPPKGSVAVHRDRVDLGERTEIGGQCVRCRHQRLLHQHRNHLFALLQGLGELEVHVVGRLVACLPDPSRADHGDDRVDLVERAQDDGTEVRAGRDRVDVAKHHVVAERRAETIVETSDEVVVVSAPGTT
jgi:hypothetical protein